MFLLGEILRYSTAKAKSIDIHEWCIIVGKSPSVILINTASLFPRGLYQFILSSAVWKYTHFPLIPASNGYYSSLILAFPLDIKEYFID